MGLSWKLGRAFGIPIYVHWTFLLLLGFIAYSTRGEGTTAMIFNGVLVLALFGCVVLHELGHALTARYFGIQTRDIILLPIGGVARLETMSEKPFEEFLIAVAGPAVNVVIAIALGLVLSAYTATSILWQDGPYALLNGMDQKPLVIQGLALLMVVNLGLVVFNMIPAFPMDGGRVFRALLSSVFGLLPATEIAAAVSMLIAVVMGLAGMGIIRHEWLPHNPMLMLVGMFVLFAGQQELAAVRHRVAARRNPAMLMPDGHAPYVIAMVPPEPNFSGFTWDRHAQHWIEWREGRPVHVSG